MKLDDKKFFSAHGFVWPKAMASKEQSPDKMHKNYIQRAPDMEVALKFVKKRGVAIQAGGHCGVWADWLSKRFGTVYTFEPDCTNFACLVHNMGGRPNVFPARGMLGDRRGPINLHISTKWIGAHHGAQEPGPFPVYIIDDMQLASLDALILDVEGMELPAIMGAHDTIRKFKPVIMLEDRGHGDKYGWGGHSHIVNTLAPLGYSEVARVAHDVVFAVKG